MQWGLLIIQMKKAKYDKLVKMFKDKIPVGVKTLAQVIDVLKAKVDTEEIKVIDLDVDDILTTEVKVAAFNAYHCMDNTNLQIKPEDMSFFVFKIVRNEKSKPYYDKMPEDIKHEGIYVILEEHTGYILSNSNSLFVELEVERGVSQHEIDTDGDQFKSLIFHLAIQAELL